MTYTKTSVRPRTSRTLALVAAAATVTLVWAIASPLVASVTVDELVEKHIAARGGQAAWEQVGALRLEGSFTGFSQINPFTLTRTPTGQYHLDHVLGDKLVVVGWDGEVAWWLNNWMGPSAQRITGADRAVLDRDIEYPLTPFFDIDSAGHKVEVIGENDLDGTAVLEVRLVRTDGTIETWFFDPDTFLEVARDSPGSDFGRAMTQRTYFDAFEEIGSTGAVMPHYVESQWYTRHRVMEVEKVAAGVDVDRAIFAMPAPIGMGPVLPLAGEWTVAAETRGQPGAEWAKSERTATVSTMMDRGLLREHMNAGDTQWERSLTYDRFREEYVLTVINDQTPYLDILKGTFEDGVLILDNAESGTTRNAFGRVIHGRFTIKDITDDGFTMEHESSIDAGENWFQDARFTYTRK